MSKMARDKKTVLDVKNLGIYYETPKGDVRAVDGISFTLYEGETLGFVGESGCGKSTSAMGILQLITPPGRIVSGEVMLEGEDLLKIKEEELRKRRWEKLALIPQGSMNSLNPTMKISDQIKDVIETHRGKQPKEEVKNRILDLFQMVGLPARIYKMYPHELSGGMKQRVCIAMAIALNPSVIIADESTSALDVVVQRVVAQTILKVKEDMGVSMIMIGHDMGLMAQMVDRVAIMYAGNIVEIAEVQELFRNPAHPYSQILIESVPSLTQKQAMRVSEGITHDPRNPPSGCIFRLRCPHASEECARTKPKHQEVRPGQSVACHLYQQQTDGSFIDVREIA